ncbi:GNAT family N-acetyltransferase [Oceanobacillus bengalensis]|uniref:N-acetyltransferase n=1 Tax=Oceanobacillus bengalensis TaxID=1435466 RepID=A0A494Z9E7_9BACI|nr:GNAT family protein [Oceanobacillus bengalensis]RKQ18689.1 N-acetyltransferase [Oceanobacillus bengalensis]
MHLTVKKMTEKYAIEVLCWKYDKPYDFYNNVLTSGAMMELLTNKYFVVLDGHSQLIGYFCTGKPAQVPDGNRSKAYLYDCIDIGIGMKPELTGKGNGHHFFSFVLRFVQEKYSKDIRLTVATFNERAIKLYENFGFERQMEFMREDVEFITMVKNRG